MNRTTCTECKCDLPFGQDTLSINAGFEVINQSGEHEYLDGINAYYYCAACFPDEIELNLSRHHETAKAVQETSSNPADFPCWMCGRMIPNSELRLDVSAMRSVYLLNDNTEYPQMSVQVFACCTRCVVSNEKALVTGIHAFVSDGESLENPSRFA